MAAQVLRSHLSEPEQRRYTLILHNGELVRCAHPLAIAPDGSPEGRWDRTTAREPEQTRQR